jgi:hypothetical protein
LFCPHHDNSKTIVIPDLRGPLGRDPDSTSVGFVFWMPAYAGMTVFFPDW